MGENDRVSIQVRDRGLGIPPAKQRDIFERFVRGAASGARNIAGTGIGLVLLDVMLPHKDGFQACRELRRGDVTTPIILLTARAQEAEKGNWPDIGNPGSIAEATP